MAQWRVLVLLASAALGACGDGNSSERNTDSGGANGSSGTSAGGSTGLGGTSGLGGMGGTTAMGGVAGTAALGGIGGTTAGQGGGAGVSPAGGGPGCGAIGCSDGVTITLFVSAEAAALTAGGFELCIEGKCSNLGPQSPEPNPEYTQYNYAASLVGDLTGEVKLRALNPGTLVFLRVPLTPDLVGDGARFTLRVASTPPCVLERFVTYTTRTNAQGCEPTTCHLGALRLYPNSGTGLRCRIEECKSGVDIRTRIPRAPSSLDYSTFRFCRNDVCSSRLFTNGTGLEQGLLVGGGLMRGRLRSDYFESGDRTGLNLRMTSNEDSYLLRNDDRYTLDVIDQAGTTLHHEEHIIDYVESFPNGQECDTVPCRFAAIP